jgi:hypothetical protein
MADITAVPERPQKSIPISLRLAFHPSSTRQASSGDIGVPTISCDWFSIMVPKF